MLTDNNELINKIGLELIICLKKLISLSNRDDNIFEAKRKSVLNFQNKEDIYSIFERINKEIENIKLMLNSSRSKQNIKYIINSESSSYMSGYENLIQRLEEEIRNNIGIQHQLKLTIDMLQESLEECEKEIERNQKSLKEYEIGNEKLRLEIKGLNAFNSKIKQNLDTQNEKVKEMQIEIEKERMRNSNLSSQLESFLIIQHYSKRKEENTSNSKINLQELKMKKATTLRSYISEAQQEKSLKDIKLKNSKSQKELFKTKVGLEIIKYNSKDSFLIKKK